MTTWYQSDTTERFYVLSSGDPFERDKETALFLGDVSVPRFFEPPKDPRRRAREQASGVAKMYGTPLDRLNQQHVWRSIAQDRLWALEGTGGSPRAFVGWVRLFYPDKSVWEGWVHEDGRWCEVDTRTKGVYSEPEEF